MKVKVKKMTVDMEIKNNGIEFAVTANDGAHQGDFYVTKTGLIWCQGKTSKANGKKVSWDEFTAWIEAK